MSNLGGFSEEALKLFQLAASERGYDDFSEGDVYDFTRCVRPDGSAYGTRGKCRKGSEEAKGPEAEPRTEGGMKRRATAVAKKEAKAASRKAAGAKISENAARTRRLKEELEKVRDRMKGASPEEQNRLVAEASKRADQAPKASAPKSKDAKGKRNYPASSETKKAYIDAYDAHRAAVKREKEAEKARKAAEKAHKKAQSKETLKALKEAIKTHGAAQVQSDRAEKAMWRAGDKHDAALRRDTRATETPAERKARREQQRLYKIYG